MELGQDGIFAKNVVTNIDMNKKVLILFSGGIDSTYLLHKNIIEQNDITLAYVNLDNNHVKTPIEKQQSAFILNEYNRDRKDPICLIDTISVTISAFLNGQIYLTQPIIWIFGMIYSGKLSDVDEIQVGYVMNDDAISYLDDIQNLYKSFEPFVHKLPKLVFPLKKEKKSEFYKELPDKIKDLVFSCEEAIFINNPSEVDLKNISYLSYNKNPDESPIIDYRTCGECVICKRQKYDGIYNDKLDYKAYLDSMEETPLKSKASGKYKLTKEGKKFAKTITKKHNIIIHHKAMTSTKKKSK